MAPRCDARYLDPSAPTIPPAGSLVLSLVLRSQRGWLLVLVAGPGLPLPRQRPSTGTSETLVVCLLGAEAYGIGVWLAAAADPAIPRMAVLVDPSLASHVCAHLRRAMTINELCGVAVLTSPGLSVASALALSEVRAPASSAPP